MKEVVLIIPDDKQGFEPLIYPPLGLLYIAAEIEKDFKAEIFDLRERENNIKMIPKAEVYCFTAVSSQYEDCKKTVEYLKNRDKNCFTIIGGSHASYLSVDAMMNFDCVVVGEGENVINDIIKNRKKGIINARLKEQKDIDDIPFPSRHLLPDKRIVTDKLWEGYRFGKNFDDATVLITSRGCPWSCSFCGNIPQKVRYRSPQKVIEEIDYLIKTYDCRKFKFLDDNFLMNRKRLKELCNLLKERNLEFRCNGRSDLITDDICKRLKSAGCKEIGFGIESADDRVLKKINKGLKVEKHKRAFKIMKKNGFLAKAFIMIGLPGETKETLEMNKRFFEEVKPDKCFCSLFTPYPGCAIWNNPLEFDVEIKNKDLKNFYQTYPANSNVDTKHFTEEENTKNHSEMIKFLEEFFNRSKNE